MGMYSAGARMVSEDGPSTKLDEACGVRRWRLHDLRRTAADLPPSNGAKGKLGNADLKEVYHAEKKAFG
jgi:hypothetical protein